MCVSPEYIFSDIILRSDKDNNYILYYTVNTVYCILYTIYYSAAVLSKNSIVHNFIRNCMYSVWHVQYAPQSITNQLINYQSINNIKSSVLFFLYEIDNIYGVYTYMFGWLDCSSLCLCDQRTGYETSQKIKLYRNS